MGRRKVEVGQRVGLRLLRNRRRPRAAPLQHVARHVVHGGHGGGVAPAEHLRDDPAHAAPELPGARLAHAVAHEVGGAALPRRPWKTSDAAATRPPCASETTSCTPETPRSRIFLRNASHESYDSVSTTSTPRTRPSRRHLT